MDELKSAVLIIRNKFNEVERVLVFEDHNDAFDVFFGMDKSQSRELSIATPEFFKSGEKPEDLPLQKKLI